MKSFIMLKDLTLSYENHPVIHHLNIDIPQCETIAIIGPNGAGKSTLLKIIMDFIQPDSGEVKRKCKLSDIAYLPQQSEIKCDLPLTVGELVASGFMRKMGLYRGLKQAQKNRVYEALSRVGMEKFEQRSIKTLSGGQLQRVLFARIIVQDSKLILLDEPFNAIDEKTIQDLCSLIGEWKASGKTVIAVIHDFQKIKQYFSYVILIARELVAAGKTEDVFIAHNIDRAYSATFFWDKSADWCEGQ